VVVQPDPGTPLQAESHRPQHPTGCLGDELVVWLLRRHSLLVSGSSVSSLPSQSCRHRRSGGCRTCVRRAGLLIERSRYQRGRLRGEKDTKTHQSRRIALDDATAAILDGLVDRHRAEAAALGGELTRDAYLFSSDPLCREPWQPDQITQRFRRLAKPRRRGHHPTRLRPALLRHPAPCRRRRPADRRRAARPRRRRGDHPSGVRRVGEASNQRAAEVLRQPPPP